MLTKRTKCYTRNCTALFFQYASHMLAIKRPITTKIWLFQLPNGIKLWGARFRLFNYRARAPKAVCMAVHAQEFQMTFFGPATCRSAQVPIEVSSYMRTRVNLFTLACLWSGISMWMRSRREGWIMHERTYLSFIQHRRPKLVFPYVNFLVNFTPESTLKIPN